MDRDQVQRDTEGETEQSLLTTLSTSEARYAVIRSTEPGGILARLCDTGEDIRIGRALVRHPSDLRRGDQVAVDEFGGIWQAAPVMSRVIERPDGGQDYFIQCEAGDRRLTKA